MNYIKKIIKYIFDVLCLIIICKIALSANNSIKYYILSEKDAYYLGEPVIIEARIVNLSDKVITINASLFWRKASCFRHEFDLTEISDIYFPIIGIGKGHEDRYTELESQEFLGRFVDFSQYLNKPGEYEIVMKYEGQISKELEIGGVKIPGKIIYLNSNKLIIKIIEKEKRNCL